MKQVILPLTNKEVVVNINYKNIKRINIKIDAIGRIYLNANHRHADADINNVLHQQIPWIEKVLKKIEKNVSLLQVDRCMNDEKVYLLGKLYNLEFDDKKKNGEIIGDYIYFKSNTKHTKKYLSILRKNNHQVLKRLFNEATKSHLSLHNLLVDVKVRSYSAVWGMYKQSERCVYLNERLIHLPVELINVVIYHELSHVYVPAHNKKFYERLESYYPNYKKSQEKLKDYAFVLLKDY